MNKLYQLHFPQSLSVTVITINGFIKMGYNTVCFSENTCLESLIQIISPTDSLSIIYQVYTATYNFNND